ncbi:hypothetical protein SPWS13_2097 [Shewanella putrefaciens]|nr:hypothetical protein SPWS13_2097 [Shewanella putrefaciens]
MGFQTEGLLTTLNIHSNILEEYGNQQKNTTPKNIAVVLKNQLILGYY